MAHSLEEVRDLLDQMVSQAQEKLRQYQQVTQTYIPDSIRDAAARKWELAANGIEFAFLMHYPSNEQIEDSRRVIKLDYALQALERLERNVVAKSSKSELQLILRQLAMKYEFASIAAASMQIIVQMIIAFIGEINWKNLWDSLKRIAEALFTFLVVFALLLLKITVIATISERYVAGVRTIMELRDECVEELRRRAFPQASGRRFLRRKLARH